MPALIVNDRLRIPEEEIEISWVRSSGPGGQNVNKVATKAELRWNARDNDSLPDDVRARFLRGYANRINERGEFVITSQLTRSADRNARDCLHRLRLMLLGVAEAPRTRRPTRPSRGARERRLRDKRQRSEKKQNRRPPSW